MLSIHHVALSVSDLTVSRDFYESLGFIYLREYTDEDVTILHLRLGEIILELFKFSKYIINQDASLDLYEDLIRVGIKHFALKTELIEDVRNHFVNLGYETTELKKGRTGIEYFFLQDPDKNYIEIVREQKK